MPGGTIHAGDLVIDPIVPATPAVEILDWTTVDPSEFLAGWRVTLAGGSGVYEVRLTDTVTEARFVFADGFEAGDTSAWAAP
jgi:hypothetical protein